MMRSNSILIPFLLILIGSLGTQVGKAQDGETKLGHVDLQAILQQMPEREQARQKMESFRNKLQKNIQEMNEEYQKKMTEFQQTQEGMTQTERQSTREQISSLQQRIQQAQQKAQQDLQSQREELLTPIIDKVENAVKEVAEEQGYTYVFDTSSGNVVYKGGGDDLTDAVKKKLDTDPKLKEKSSGEEKEMEIDLQEGGTDPASGGGER